MIHTRRPPDNTQLLPPPHHTDPEGSSSSVPEKGEGVQNNLQVLSMPPPGYGKN